MDITTNATNSSRMVENSGCSVSAEETQYAYNLGQHIASVFIVLVVSFLGAFLSIISMRVKRLHINPIIINTGKFFGCGYVEVRFFHLIYVYVYI